MLDFNDTPLRQDTVVSHDQEREEVRAALLDRLEPILLALLPAAKIRAGKLIVGDVLGSPGRSLEFELEGERRGLWIDRSAQTGGDVYDFLAQNRGLDVRQQFAQVLVFARELLGRPEVIQASPVSAVRINSKPKKTAALDDLGPATAKWDYLDASGRLIACVYRYDPVGEDGTCRKEFRPWDAKRRKAAPPEPRPLYNQPGMLTADTVVLVEGEKCAQALIDVGICATTAMHGANAPVHKTDWSPLRGKAVLIWPDKDPAGWEYAMAAAQAVQAAGAKSCELLMPPPEHPESWDAADALAQEFDVTGFITAGERLPLGGPSAATAESDNLSNIDPFSDVDWRTEDGLALAFSQHQGIDWRYCASWGKWFGWAGGRWNEDRSLVMQHLIRELTRRAVTRADSPRLKARLASSSTVSAVERLARSDRIHATLPEAFDANIWLLNTPQGLIDLQQGLLRPHERESLTTKMATASPQGESPAWQMFLNDVTGGDIAMQAYLQRVVGYCLTGSTQEHALFFLYGTGANGKSVFVNVVATILGDYARHAPMETFMDSASERHPTELASLRGARFVTATETEQGRRWNESRIKALTGGDPISARFMRQDFFEYIPQFKLVIAGNHKPAIRNVDEAMRRRLHLIPFTVTIPPERRDRQLTEKLLQERNGVLNWALDGCLAWQRDGLMPPKVVLDATREYFNNEDAIQEFEDEDLLRDDQAQVPMARVYARWKSFAERNGYYAGSSRWLSEQLVMRGFVRVKLGGGVRGFRGVRLKPTEEPWKPYSDD